MKLVNNGYTVDTRGPFSIYKMSISCRRGIDVVCLLGMSEILIRLTSTIWSKNLKLGNVSLTILPSISGQ